MFSQQGFPCSGIDGLSLDTGQPTTHRMVQYYWHRLIHDLYQLGYCHVVFIAVLFGKLYKLAANILKALWFA